MCLNIVYRRKQKKEALAKLPDMITCWKVVQKQGNQHGSRFVPEMYKRSSLFLTGWNVVEPYMSYNSGYRVAFHAFQTKKGAEDWKGYYKHIVKCKTRKKDIVAIGEQRGHLCLVTKRIWIPKPKKKPA